MPTIGNLLNPHDRGTYDGKSALGTLAEIMNKRAEEERAQKLILQQKQQEEAFKIAAEQRDIAQQKAMNDYAFKKAEEFNKQQRMQELFSNQEQTTNDLITKASSAENNPRTGVKVVNIPKEATMSMIGGGFGDINEQPISQPQQRVIPSIGARAIPSIRNGKVNVDFNYDDQNKDLELVQRSAAIRGINIKNEDGSLKTREQLLSETASGSGSNSVAEGDPFEEHGIPEEEREDYILQPVLRNVRGIPERFNVPKRKTELNKGQIDLVVEGASTISDLKKNLNTLKSNIDNKNFNIGPGIVTRGGAVGDIGAQWIRGPEFASFKGDVGRAFQKYRKWATGVAAGYPELSLLAPNFPKTTDEEDVFITKSLSAIDDMERNYGLYLNALSKSNYAVSKYRDNYGGYPSSVLGIMGDSGGSQMPTAGGTSYQAGETRNINGVTYTRDENGNWRSE